MDGVAAQCSAQSVGPANQLFGLLIQTLLAAQCSLSSPQLWPQDYGEQFSDDGMQYFKCIYDNRIQVKNV